MADSLSSSSSCELDKTPASTERPSFDSAASFDSPPRKTPRINPFGVIFKLSLAFGLIAALITGYVIGLRIFDLGLTSIGLYGTILISEYLVQLTCALVNRFDVNRIVRNLKKTRTAAQKGGDFEKGGQGEPASTLLNPGSEVSIAVVGYREDEKAWRDCLRSLQTQTLRPKCIIGVVDGNEEPDLSMANAFTDEFEAYKAPLIQLPILLSELHRETYLNNIPADTRGRARRFFHWLSGRHRMGHALALSLARRAVINQVLEWNDTWNISSLDAVCFSQPHGHKRTAMFTAFAMSLYALRTRDGIFTTDSDTLLQSNSLDEMLALLTSSPELGGVTADVKIWNRSESFLARMCSARYWFAFNVERACQSLFRCVGCLSGPMSMYRSCDLETILGPWNLQTFGGKQTTFGDDRHLTNQLLAHGLKTRYTHRTWCDSESPTSFKRWIVQQTRWSKSFFRESFWFPASFAYHSPWMLLEMTVQALYPFILIATIFHFLFDMSSDNNWRPVIWLVTMFGIALFKSVLAVLISGDFWLLLFSFYGFIYFFGLLPSKIWALVTMKQTGWGTSARSSSERKRGSSFRQRAFHVGHLVIWYTGIFVGVGFFTYKIFRNPLLFLIGALAIILSFILFWDRPAFLDRLKSRVKVILKGRKGKENPANNMFDSDSLVDIEKVSPAFKSKEHLSRASTRRDSVSSKAPSDLDLEASTICQAYSTPIKRMSAQFLEKENLVIQSAQRISAIFQEDNIALPMEPPPLYRYPHKLSLHFVRYSGSERNSLSKWSAISREDTASSLTTRRKPDQVASAFALHSLLAYVHSLGIIFAVIGKWRSGSVYNNRRQQTLRYSSQSMS